MQKVSKSRELVCHERGRRWSGEKSNAKKLGIQTNNLWIFTIPNNSHILHKFLSTNRFSTESESKMHRGIDVASGRAITKTKPRWIRPGLG